MSQTVHLDFNSDAGPRRATLTISRPPLNILDMATLQALEAAVGQLADMPELALVVVRGAGERAFSAGVAVEDHTPAKVGDMLRHFHAALEGLRTLPPLTLAAVRGHCLGGGMELAMACDLLLAANNARFGQPEIELGCFPPHAAAFYPSRLGYARTLELLATGRLFGAEEAEGLGITTWRVPPEELEARLEELAATLLAKSTPVLRLTKKAVLAGASQPPRSALDEAERLYLEDLCKTQDMDEGLAAFLEKRKPEWKHR